MLSGPGTPGEEVWAPPSHCGWGPHAPLRTLRLESPTANQRITGPQLPAAFPTPWIWILLQPIRCYFSIRTGAPVSRALLLLTTWGFWLWVFSPHPCQCGHLKSCEDEMTCAFVKYLAQRGSRDDSKLLSSTFEACLLIFPKSHYSGSYDWKQTENSLQEVIQIFL